MDIYDDHTSFNGRLEIICEYDSKFVKFVKYNVKLTVLENEYLFPSKSGILI